MASTLEHCLREIQELELRIRRLEEALSRTGQLAQPLFPRRDAPQARAPETVVMKPDVVLPVLRFEDEQPRQRATLKVDAQAALEANPRVLDRIRMLWFYPECEQLLDKLIIDDRGNRAGFNRDIMDELLFLARLSRSVKMSQGLSNAGRSERADVWADQRIQRHA
jgi:hypothetical protein